MAETQLYASFDTAFRDLNEAIFISTKKQIVWCNQQATELLGYESPEEIIGTDDLKHLASIQHKKGNEKKQTMFTTGIPQDGVFLLNRKDGSQITCVVRASLLRRPGEHLMILIPRVVSVEEQDEKLKHFINLLKHEVNTPLSVIWGYAELIENVYGDRVPDEVVKFLHHIVDNVKRLDRINKILMKYELLYEEQCPIL